VSGAPVAWAGRQAGRHALVTGAGTGIGRAIARRLAAEGARVSLVGRTRARLEETLEAIRGDVPAAEAAVFEADVRDADAIGAATAAAREAFGPLHAVVANAGIAGPNGPDAAGTQRFDEIVATNVGGTYRTLRAGLAHLADGGSEARRRHLVATSSILARIGVPGYTAYCASKAGVSGLVRALAAEVAPEGVQVNAVAPGWVDTSMAWDGIDGFAAALGVTREEAHAEAMKAVPLGRMSRPEEIAGMVAWLVSDDALGVTGQTLDMNGGAHMS